MESNFALVTWNSENDRYELHIGGVLKAYVEGNDTEQELGRQELVKMAETKGYTVHSESK